jgi:hypothetical protein
MKARAALIALGACAGAALALPLVTLDETWQLAGMLLAVLVGVLLATVLARDDDKPEPVTTPLPEPQRRPAPQPTPQPTPPAQQATARIVLDADPPSGGGQWWTQTGTAPRATSNGDTPRPAAQPRDLAGYVDTARVVQCPRCGSFQIDVTRLAAGYSFRCRTDEHAWQWQPGRAWPATVVVSRRRNP